MRAIRGWVLTAAATWLLAYLFDPETGKRRRAIARDRIAAFARRTSRTVGRRRRFLAGQAQGIAHRADLSRTESPPPDDVTLARKVESIIFRDPAIPKGNINVMVVDGVVELRGVADHPEMIGELEQTCASIAGVRRVENLLHLPKTPPPGQ